MYEVNFNPVFSLIHVNCHCTHILLSLVIHRYIFLTTTNGQQKSLAATNNRNVPLITDDFYCLPRKKRVLKAIEVHY